ncbi:MAG: protein-glutamate O-methyltransferase CheR [Nitrospinota bacterium]|nr:protein-glutamate O-methyltransferase CheR [Nitrospinota bacterium]
MSVTPNDFNYIRQLLLDRAAIVIEENKEYLVESRIGPVAKNEGYDSIEKLVQALRNNSNNGLHNKVVEALTTNETSFFRDVQPFETLKTLVLPEMLKERKTKRELNIWCGASSSGQEPYSIAMIIKENFPLLLDWKLNFIASDISTEMLNRCRSGEFSQLEVNRGLSAPLLIKYFEKDGLRWSIKKELREMVEFKQINLAETFPYLPKMDIIFMRNVLIYFDIEMKKKILKQLRSIMQPDSYLFLGAAETTLNLDESYARVDVKYSGCYRLKG